MIGKGIQGDGTSDIAGTSDKCEATQSGLLSVEGERTRKLGHSPNHVHGTNELLIPFASDKIGHVLDSVHARVTVAESSLDESGVYHESWCQRPSEAEANKTHTCVEAAPTDD